MNRFRVIVLDGEWKQRFYQPLYDQLEADCLPVRSTDILQVDLTDVDLLMVNDEFGSLGCEGIARCREHGIPTLHLIDGVIDWRNTWQNRRSSSDVEGMPLFRPVLADKIGVIGASQYRILEFFGNGPVCEITGSPRFDVYSKPEMARLPKDGLLVTTANTTAYTDQQTVSVLQSLRDLRDVLRQRKKNGRPPLYVTWRVDQTIADELDVQAERSSNLIAALSQHRMLISTPSTCVLEGMMCGRPSVILDYIDSPSYLQSAWKISHRQHMETVFDNAWEAPALEMDFQRMVCRDQVSHVGESSTRVAELATKMMLAGRLCRANGATLQLPPGLLSQEELCVGLESLRRYDELHPHHPVFAERSLRRLQAELGHARLVNRQLSETLRRRQLWAKVKMKVKELLR